MENQPFKIFAIDPGTTQSAYVIWGHASEIIEDMGIVENDRLLQDIDSGFFTKCDAMAIEMVACYGMPVGVSIFETVVWTGRFIQEWSRAHDRVYRRDIKLHFCGSARAKDSNIAQALRDRFGDPGTKKAPGKLYGVKKDIWAALSVAVYYADNIENEEERRKWNYVPPEPKKKKKKSI